MTEMTATSRCAIFRFMPDEDGKMHIVVQANNDYREGFVAVDTARQCIWGYNPVHRIYQGWGERAGFSGWFVVQFQRPFRHCGVKDSVAFVTLDVKAGEQVLVKASTSFTGIDGAWRNLRAELPGWDFLGTRLALDRIWQDELRTIDVEDSDKAKVNEFYGALYRTAFEPHAISDVDGRYPAFASGQPMMPDSTDRAQPLHGLLDVGHLPCRVALAVADTSAGGVRHDTKSRRYVPRGRLDADLPLLEQLYQCDDR